MSVRLPQGKQSDMQLAPTKTILLYAQKYGEKARGEFPANPHETFGGRKAHPESRNVSPSARVYPPAVWDTRRKARVHNTGQLLRAAKPCAARRRGAGACLALTRTREKPAPALNSKASPAQRVAFEEEE